MPESRHTQGPGRAPLIRPRSLAGWTAVWSEAGVARGMITASTAKAMPIRAWVPGYVHLVPDAAGWSVGDLVVVCAGRVPGVGNQHLRRVEGISPAGADGMHRIALGRPLPRREWPAALRTATAPATLTVEARDGKAVFLDALGVPMASLDVEDPAKYAASAGALVCLAALSGRADGARGSDRFEVRSGRDGAGRREWVVEDARGTVHARGGRWLLDAAAPAPLVALRDAANMAYREGCLEAALFPDAGPRLAA